MGGVPDLRGAWILAASILSRSRRQQRYCLEHPDRYVFAGLFFSSECTSICKDINVAENSATTMKNHCNHPLQRKVFNRNFQQCLCPLIHGTTTSRGASRLRCVDCQRRGFQEILVRSMGTMVRGGSVASTNNGNDGHTPQIQSLVTKGPSIHVHHSADSNDESTRKDDDAIAWIRRFWLEKNKHKQQICLENATRLYCASNHETRMRLVEHLALACGPIDHDAIRVAIAEYCQVTDVPATTAATPARSLSASIRAAHKIQVSTTPKYQELFERICAMTQDPIQFLIQLRLDLQQYIRADQAENKHLVIYENLHHHLIQKVIPLCFSISQLDVRRITMDESPAILALLVNREAVHPVVSLQDFVQTRIQDPHKRVYALFHRLQQLPLVVLHVSMQPTIPARLREIFERNNDDAARVVAAFYSISNLQPGLEGIGLGETLIRAAVQHISREEPQNNVQIQIFTTLSPMPGFRKWLEEIVAHGGNDRLWQCFDPADIQFLCTAWKCQPRALLPHLLGALKHQYDRDPRRIERVGDQADTSELSVVLGCLARLAAHYLIREKVHDSKLRNTVARFHVHNGAQVYRINTGADLSKAGWTQSFGVMVNYKYDMGSLQDNQEAYEANGTIAVHEIVSTRLLSGTSCSDRKPHGEPND